MKRIIAMLVIIAICLEFLPVSAFADTTQRTDVYHHNYNRTIESGKKTHAESETCNLETLPKKDTFEGDGFSVSFEIQESWENGFNANVIIENTGETAIENWSLQFDYQGEINSVWNAVLNSNEPGKYVVKNAGWNQDIAAGESVSFGISGQGKFSGFPSNYQMLGRLVEQDLNNYSIDYILSSDWGNGFTANVIVSNNTDTIFEDWVLEFDFDRNITQIWNATIENHVGDHYVIKNCQYNSSIAQYGSISFGFCGDEGCPADVPSNYRLSSYTLDAEPDLNSDACKVTFDYNYEGASAPVMLEVKSGQALTPIAAPQRDGYIFVGWYCDKAAQITRAPYDFAEDPITTDTTLYAQWFKQTAQLSDGEIDNLYIEYAIIPNLLLRGMDASDIRLSDDYDGDGLTLIEEYDLDTSPFSEDSDEDGMSDYDEVKVFGTNPLKKDTDGDGLSDGKEVLFGSDPLSFEAVFSITTGYDSQNGINASVRMTLNGSQAESLKVEKLTDNYLLPSDMPGFIDDAYSFSVDGEFDTAELSFRFNEGLLTDPGFNPVIYYFNEELQELEELPTEVIGNTATTTVEHFSIYMLLNKTDYIEAFEWLDVWQNETYSKADVIFVIDDSGSMSSNDRSNNRLTVARKLIDNLPQNSRAAVVSFASSVKVLQSLTADRDVLKDKLTTNYFKSSGGTYMYSGINSAFGLFDEESDNSLKSIVVLTDGETSGTNSHSSVMQKAQNAGIQIYTVGLGNSTTYFNKYLKPLAEGTGGRFYLASQADELNAIYENIGKSIDLTTDTDMDGIADYFEDHMTLFNGVKMMLDKNNPDTDGDELYDGAEIALSLEYTADRKKVKVTGRLYSNPTKIDSDNDGINDLVDAVPLIFDVAITDITETYIYFNTGKKWKNFDFDSYTFSQLMLSGSFIYLDSDEFDKAYSAAVFNESVEYSKGEYCLIAALNPHGARIRMTYESSSMREDVFEFLTGQENKYYQHTGILWWTTWEEVPKGTEGGFFTGKVLTDADINLSRFECQLSIDYIDTINALAIIGATVFAVYLAATIIPVIKYEISAIVWYVKTYGLTNGLSMYMNFGSYFYGTSNSIINALEADASDGKLDGVEIISNIGIEEDGVGFETFKKLKDYLGSAGEHNDWHHIVEQSQIAKSGFLPQQINNTSNIIAVDHSIHMKITGYYNSILDFTGGLRVRDWLAGQSFQDQYEFGLDVLRKFGVIG